MIMVTHGSSRMSPCFAAYDDPGDGYFAPEGSYAYTSTTLKAVSYR